MRSKVRLIRPPSAGASERGVMLLLALVRGRSDVNIGAIERPSVGKLLCRERVVSQRQSKAPPYVDQRFS